MSDWRYIPVRYRNRVVLGDCVALGLEIPDDSIDLIFTDPPWDDGSVYLYDWLANHAARVLVDGGLVAAYTGNYLLPQIDEFFKRAGLNRYWLLAGVQMNSDSIYQKQKIFVKWRPIPVYQKGHRVVGNLPDALYTQRDKTYHPWGQGLPAVRRWIAAMTKEDDIVLEPFTGGGTTPVACIELKRRFIAFEKDAETFAICSERVRTTTPPLFVVPYPELIQITMELED